MRNLIGLGYGHINRWKKKEKAMTQTLEKREHLN